MFKILLLAFLVFSACAGGGKSLQNDLPLGKAGDLYQFSFKKSDDAELKMAELKGKPVLVINIATRCGYTKQLDQLEKLYQQYKARGLVVVGVPSNDFLSQTPEADKAVVEFCRLKYGVTFLVVNKVKVLEDADPFFRYLRELRHKEVSWNFEKFLFDKEGRLVNSFSSSTGPFDPVLLQNIDRYL